MCQDFPFVGLFSKTEEGTGFHSAKSFDRVLCSKSETQVVSLAVVHGCYYFLVAQLNY